MKFSLDESLFEDTISADDLPDVDNLDISLDMDELEELPYGEEIGIIEMLNDMIQDELATVTKYNSVMATLQEAGRTDIAKLINDIVGEENTHVGQLQAALKNVSPSAENIDAGQEEGQHQLNDIDDDFGSLGTNPGMAEFLGESIEQATLESPSINVSRLSEIQSGLGWWDNSSEMKCETLDDIANSVHVVDNPDDDFGNIKLD